MLFGFEFSPTEAVFIGMLTAFVGAIVLALLIEVLD